MSAEEASPADRDLRERDFWDHRVPSLAECLDLYKEGPDVHTAAMLDAIDPKPAMRVLDFACGAGLTCAWLRERGADVVGIDVSPISIRRAGELAEALGLDIELRIVGVGIKPTQQGETFDALVGRFALHHVDLEETVPLLARSLRIGGRGAFVETMATNPLLRVARARLVGRFGVARYGTTDEHPLTRADLKLLERSFGKLEIQVPQFDALKLIDRQTFNGSKPRFANALGKADDQLGRFKALNFLSYHQVLVLERTH